MILLEKIYNIISERSLILIRIAGNQCKSLKKYKVNIDIDVKASSNIENEQKETTEVRPKRINDDHKNKFYEMFLKGLPGYIEVREIPSDNKGYVKTRFFKSEREFKEYNPPTDIDVYVGVYSRNKKGGGKRKNVRQTRVLWVDLDNVNKEQADYLTSFMPSPTMKVKSGHGFHYYWKLNKRVGKEIEPLLKKLAEKSYSENDDRGGDSGAAEVARIMRMPGTINMKRVPKRCKIIEHNNKTYSLEKLADILKVTPHLSEKDKLRDLDIDEEKIKKYKKIQAEVDRNCVKNMLDGVKEGQRNFALGRITMHLRYEKGYSREKTKEIVKIWNTLNDPPENKNKVETDFGYYCRGKYNLLGCNLKEHKDKQKILSKYCDKQNCKLKGNYGTNNISDEVCWYNNRLINQIKKISGHVFLLYAVLNKNKELSIDELVEKTAISKDTLYKGIDYLMKKDMIKSKTKYFNNRETEVYWLSKTNTFGTGRMAITYKAINRALDGEISYSQFKIYILLWKYKVMGKTNEVYPSTTTLGEKLGIDRTTVSKHLKPLKEAGFIEIDYEDDSRNSNVYKLKV